MHSVFGRSIRIVMGPQIKSHPSVSPFLERMNAYPQNKMKSQLPLLHSVFYIVSRQDWDELELDKYVLYMISMPQVMGQHVS